MFAALHESAVDAVDGSSTGSALPPNAEVAVRANVEPILLKGGGPVKSLCAAFLGDLEEDWRQHGKEIFPALRDKYPQAYYQGIISLARTIRWEVGPVGAYNRPSSPEEILNELEERVGPEGRRLFEKFLKQLNKLHAQQQLEAQAQTDDSGGG
jgi:hypothetical protein